MARAETPGTHGAFVGLSTMRFDRALILSQGAQTQEDRDGLWTLGVWGGYRATLTDPEASSGALQLDAALGVLAVPHTGAVPLALQVTPSWIWRFRHELRLGIGVRLGVTVDLPDADYPMGQLTIPVSLGWSWLELQVGAGLSFPLAMDSRPVYGGSLERGAAVALLPVEVALVFRVF